MSELDRILDEMGAGYDDAQYALQDGYDQAIAAMEMGNAEAADMVLQGLGMSIEEREKWFDIATDALQPVIQYGKQYEPDARRFMDHANELIFNPDSIYGTEMWKSLKGQMTEAITNSASASSGLLSGNYLDELAKRTMALGADFRNSEINNAMSGFNAAMVPVSAGLNAQGRIGDYAMNTGAGIAGDIGNAYGNAASIKAGGAANLANLYSGMGQGMANINLSQASDIANARIADQLAQRNERSGFLNSLVGAAGTILGGGDFLPSIFDKSRKHGYQDARGGNLAGQIGDMFIPWR